MRKKNQKIACCVHTVIYYVLAQKRGSWVLRLASFRDPKTKKNRIKWKSVRIFVFMGTLGRQRNEKRRRQCAKTTVNTVVFVSFSFSLKSRWKELSSGFGSSFRRFWVSFGSVLGGRPSDEKKVRKKGLRVDPGISVQKAVRPYKHTTGTLLR